MPDVLLQAEFEVSQKAYALYDEGKIDEAVKVTLFLESKATSYSDEHEHDLCLKYAGPCMIDIGFAAGEKDMVERGTLYLRTYFEKYGSDEVTTAYELYNIANGYFLAWKLGATEELSKGIDSDALRLSRKFYRRALDYLLPVHFESGLACELYTNYGNLLDSIGRAIEAIDAYNSALRVNPDMGMALGNKGVALIHLARVTHGVTHRFYIEAIRLLEKALQQPLKSEARQGFKSKIEQLRAIVAAHNEEMEPEKIESVDPQSNFHKFLCDFCVRHALFLSPVTMLGEDDRKFYGDPMFIEQMTVGLNERDKADRYVTFLNEIKQEYILGRYFLVQSQFSIPELDVVDEGVLLVYPLDYSLHSVYIQLLKTSLKQAISVLDKVAFFLYDYCKMKTPASDKVSFLQIWGGGDRLPKQLRSFENPYLLALFYLARDVAKSGEWNFIYQHRNALTHRFLVLHDIDLGQQQANSDIPRAQEDDFTNQVIFATKIARAAVMYLILFVALEEQRLSAESSGIRPTIYATKLDKGFRHRPRH